MRSPHVSKSEELCCVAMRGSQDRRDRVRSAFAIPVLALAFTDKEEIKQSR